MSLSQVQTVPEMRRLVEVAEAFVAGRVPFLAFYYTSLDICRTALSRGVHGPVGELCHQWLTNVERCRNEWGLANDPLTEAELKAWVAAQLVM